MMELENENIYEESEGEEEENIDSNENSESKKKFTRIGNKLYDEDTLNRITIVRLSQVGVPSPQIRKLLKVSRSLVSKWVNYKKREQKKWVGHPNLQKNKKNIFVIVRKEN